MAFVHASTTSHPWSRALRGLLAGVVALGGAIVPLMAAPGTVAALAPPHPWDIPTADWMGTYAQELGPKRLMDVPVPGTHDSVTFDLGNEVSPDASFNVVEELTDAFSDCPSALGFLCDAVFDSIIGLADSEGSRITRQWAVTQTRDFTDQLEDGIRSIDLRVCRKPDGTMWGCHGMYTRRELRPYLEQIADFMDAHPTEIIRMSVRAVGNGGWNVYDDDSNFVSAYDRQPLIDLIHEVFAGKLIPETNADGTPLVPRFFTYDQLWASPERMYLIGESELALADGFHPSDSISNYYDTADPAVKREAVETNLRARAEVYDCTEYCAGPDEYRRYSVSGNLTPDTDSIIQGAVAELLAGSATLQAAWLIADAAPGDLQGALGFDPLDPTIPFGLQDIPFLDADGNPQIRPGMIAQARRGVYVPVFDWIDADPQLRRNFDGMSIDGYDRVDGYVDAMIALAITDTGTKQIGIEPRDGGAGLRPAQIGRAAAIYDIAE